MLHSGASRSGPYVDGMFAATEAIERNIGRVRDEHRLTKHSIDYA